MKVFALGLLFAASPFTAPQYELAQEGTRYCAVLDLRVVEGKRVDEQMVRMFKLEMVHFIYNAQHHSCPYKH